MDTGEQDEQRRKRVRQLAKMYTAMRDKEAAAIMAKLDDEMITEILLQMKDREAGKLLAALAALEADRGRE